MLPRYTADLIELLDQTVETPTPPASAGDLASFRQNLDTWLHRAGRRSLVDELKDLWEAQERGDQEDGDQDSQAPSSTVLDTRVLPDTSGIRRYPHAHSVGVGGASEFMGDDDL